MSVRVAVIDSGWGGAGRSGCGGVGDALGHGTVCASRVLQVWEDAEIVPIRVFDERLETSVSRLCRAIREAVAKGARVVNLSLATARADALLPLYHECQSAHDAGAIVVAAAANRGGRSFPAQFHPVLSVRAGPQTDLMDFAYERGAAIECEAAAAGVPVRLPDGVFTRRSGNSIATATMSGIVARRLSEVDSDLAGIRRWLASVARDSSAAGARVG